jgi:signal transduction histidine kinase
MKAVIIVSIVFQFIAAFIALRISKHTKFNMSWILISTAFLLIAIRGILDLVPFYYKEVQGEIYMIYRLLEILIAFLLLSGVIFIKQLFKSLKRVDDIRRESEKKVLQAVMDTEEKERRKLAKDLHDGIGPLLSNIKMSVSALDRSQIKDFNQTVIDNISSLINESIVSLKDISNNLSPHILNSFGLASAVNSFIENINRLGKIDVSFSGNLENIRFESQTESNLYRIICELFQNTVKHAEAANISLLMHYQDGKLVAQYFDDGIGFDIPETESLNGMGMSNIQSRIKAMNGVIEHRRIQPKGMMTSITIRTKAKISSHA